MSSHTLFIRGLPFDCEEVRSLLAGCVGVTLLADRFGGNPHRGCGFVQFGSAERLRDALALSGRITLGGRQIFLERRRSEP